MRSTPKAAVLGLCLALAAACGKTKDEEEQTNAACVEYCAAVEAACPAGTAHGQYPAHGLIACYDFCDGAAAFGPGTAGDLSGDTLACRRTHAQLAVADPANHCTAAGPTGGNVCGSWCGNYCTLALKNCTGTNRLFTDLGTCLAACAAYPTNGPLDTMSDSVQCRLMEAAESGVRSTCCEHASPTSSQCT